MQKVLDPNKLHSDILEPDQKLSPIYKVCSGGGARGKGKDTVKFNSFTHSGGACTCIENRMEISLFYYGMLLCKADTPKHGVSTMRRLYPLGSLNVLSKCHDSLFLVPGGHFGLMVAHKEQAVGHQTHWDYPQ